MRLDERLENSERAHYAGGKTAKSQPEVLHRKAINLIAKLPAK
jgi:hypothetical protein